MPVVKSTSPARPAKSANPMVASKQDASVSQDIDGVLGSLKRLATKSTLEGMSRYGIPQGNAFGVSMSNIQKLAKSLGRSHELAAALWQTGQYEARMLACYVDEPARVTSAQMDRWCRDFDSWAIVDTVCFKLFDQVDPALAFRKVEQWCPKKDEFTRRAGFVMLACMALHDRVSDDGPFVRCLPLVEKYAGDERNFVKKGVSWALRSVGRRSAALHAKSVAMAQRFAASSDPTVRWLGKDVLRDIGKPALAKKLAAKGRGKRGKASR